MKNAKKKVMIISETLTDGVGKHIVDLLENLDRDNYHITVLYSEKRMNDRFRDLMAKTQAQIDYYEIPHMTREISPASDYKAYKEVLSFMKVVKPDIVHCHSSKAGVIGRLAARKSGVSKVYYTPHAYAAQNRTLSENKRKLYLFIERYFSKHYTTLTLNVSEGEKAFAIKNGFNTPAHFKVIYNCLAEKEINEVQVIDLACELDKSDNVIIGYVARMYTQKNPMGFLEIAKKVCDKRDNARFIWIGHGEQFEEVKDFIVENKLVSRINLMGYQQQVDEFYEVMDVYFTPALYEGLPYTVIEALRAGCPIVASNVTGNNEVVCADVSAPRQNGFLFDLEKPDDAVEAILKLIDDERLRKELSDNSRFLYESKFTIEHMMDAYEALYGGVLI